MSLSRRKRRLLAFCAAISLPVLVIDGYLIWTSTSTLEMVVAAVGGFIALFPIGAWAYLPPSSASQPTREDSTQ